MARWRNNQKRGGLPGKKVSPREFPEPEGGYRDFKIDDLFIVKSPKRKFNANAVSFGGRYPYVARGSSNNGIRGYVDLNPIFLNEANSLSFGQDTATIFYQKEPYFTGDKIKVLILRNEKLDALIACYLITSMRKAFQCFSWGVSSFSEGIIKGANIVLPCNIAGRPDFKFMHERVRELEEERVRELEAYLKVAGFEDCILTAKEKSALNLIDNGLVDMKEVAIGTLFEIIKGKRLTKAEMIPGDINFIGATSQNNGITAKIANDSYIHPKNTITVTYNGSVGEAFYQTEPYWASDDVNVLYSNVLNEDKALFFLAPLAKKGKKYAYSFKWTKEKMETDKIYLPVDKCNNVDYALVETYIRAVKKECIARLRAEIDREKKVYHVVID